MTVHGSGLESNDKPTGYFLLVPPKTEADRQINLREVARTVWGGRYLILACALGFTLIAALHVYVLATPIYESEAVVAVRVDGANTGGGLGGELGGLASLAGVNIGNRNPMRTSFIAVLKSRRLVEKLIKQKNLMPTLFSGQYDFSRKQWISGAAPTMDDAVRMFRGISDIKEDDLTGLLTVTVGWKDRFVAAEWTENLIELANQELRTSALRAAQDNVAYLEKEAARTQVESVRQSIVHLLDSNLNREMLANVQKNYAFEIIDPPTVADANRPVYPQRKPELMGGFLSGTILAVIFVLWRGHGGQPVQPTSLTDLFAHVRRAILSLRKMVG